MRGQGGVGMRSFGYIIGRKGLIIGAVRMVIDGRIGRSIVQDGVNGRVSALRIQSIGTQRGRSRNDEA